jgi:RNA polymerase sigma factor (sigma-70 family)
VNDPPERRVDDDSTLATVRVTLAKQLAALPRRQRDVVALRYLADLTEAQVAALLGVSQGSVKRHAQRGLSALRALQIEGVV